MLPDLFRVVLDTNILVRALVNARSSSGRILAACEQRLVIPQISKPVLAEYRAILNHPQIVERYPELQPKKVRVVIERLCYLADVIRATTIRFKYPRDPKDEKLIELAIAARATHLISTDHDLLDLPTGRDDASKRFRQRLPRIAVLEPGEFLQRHADELGIP